MRDFTFAAEKTVRYLHQDAGAVTALGVGSLGSAVLQVFQYRQRIVDRVIGFFPFDIGDDADAAGIVFKLGMVQPLRLRQSMCFFHFCYPPLQT